MSNYQKKAIASRNLILFTIGKLTAMLGSSVYTFAISLYILSVTGSAMSFSISLLCSTLPRIFLGPFAGVFIDRFNRKTIIVLADFCSAIVAGILFVVFTQVSSEIVVLYVASICLNTVSVFYSTAITATIPNMIDSERIQKASGINQAISSLSGILGPVIGGFLFAIVSLPTFMLLNTCTFLISAVTALFIHYDLYTEEKQEVAMGVLTSLKEGFIYVKHHRFLGALIQLALILNFFFAALMVYLPYISVTIRGLSSSHFGLIEAGVACGTFLSAMLLSNLPEFKKKSRIMLWSVIGLGAGIILIGIAGSDHFEALSSNFVVMYLFSTCFVMGMLVMVINIPIYVVLQKETPDEYRGRVMSILETGANAISPLGYLIFGAIVAYISPVYILIVIGFILIGLALYSLKKKVLNLETKGSVLS